MRTALVVCALLLAAPVHAADGSLFAPVAKVLKSPRCVNCHPADDVPRQLDDARPHAQQVNRNLEKLGMACATCHAEKQLISLPHVPPGAPNWHLPPKSMAFTKSDADLCRDLKDPKTNGDKSLEELLIHVEEDDLVKWGWSPGPGRTTPPLSHADFTKAFKAWVDAGAPCPT